MRLMKNYTAIYKEHVVHQYICMKPVSSTTLFHTTTLFQSYYKQILTYRNLEACIEMGGYWMVGEVDTLGLVQMEAYKARPAMQNEHQV